MRAEAFFIFGGYSFLFYGYVIIESFQSSIFVLRMKIEFLQHILQDANELSLLLLLSNYLCYVLRQLFDFLFLILQLSRQFVLLCSNSSEPLSLRLSFAHALQLGSFRCDESYLFGELSVFLLFLGQLSL